MMDNLEMNKKQQLMYDLIFLDKEEYEINLLEYINEIKFVEIFVDKLTTNIKNAGVKIKEQVFILTKDKTALVLKIKR